MLAFLVVCSCRLCYAIVGLERNVEIPKVKVVGSDKENGSITGQSDRRLTPSDNQ